TWLGPRTGPPAGAGSACGRTQARSAPQRSPRERAPGRSTPPPSCRTREDRTAESSPSRGLVARTRKPGRCRSQAPLPHVVVIPHGRAHLVVPPRVIVVTVEHERLAPAVPARVPDSEPARAWFLARRAALAAGETELAHPS